MATLSLDFLRNYRLGTYRESEPVAYQYDQGHVLNILVPGEVTSAEVQYWTRGMTEAAAYEVGSITQQTDGSYVIECNVPNEFFDTWGDLRVYLVVTDDSKYVVTYEGRIRVMQREKPEDYVDDDPDNEALRILTEAREAAQSASADADRVAQVAASIPADYSELSGDVDDLTQDVSSLNERLEDKAEQTDVVILGNLLATKANASDLNGRVKKPVENPNGTSGQILRTLGNGETEWANYGLPSDAQTAEAVQAWLNEHPEATTTVLDGSITRAKLNPSVVEDLDGKAPAIFDEIGDRKTFSKAEIMALEHWKELYLEGDPNANIAIAFAENILSDINPETVVTQETFTRTAEKNGVVKFSGYVARAVTVYMHTYGSGSVSEIPLSMAADAGSVLTYGVLTDGTIEKLVSTTPITAVVIFLYTDGTNSGEAIRASINDIGFITRNFTVPEGKTVNKIRIGFTVSTSVNFDCTLSFGLLLNGEWITSTLPETGKLVYDESQLENGFSSMPYTSTIKYIADTKKYINDYMPDGTITLDDLEVYEPTKENLHYVTPEMYGAVGDGVADDTTAFQASIDAAITGRIPLKAFGIYKTSRMLVFAQSPSNSLRCYSYEINRINYSGTDDYAVTIKGSCGRFIFGFLQSNKSGICLQGHESGNGTILNYIFASYVNADLDCFCADGSVYQGVHYNTIRIMRPRSENRNCFASTDGAGENRYFDSSCYCPNGWAIYGCSGRYYNFAIEGDAKNGICALTNNAANITSFRWAEHMDHYVEGVSGTVLKVVGEGVHIRIIGPEIELRCIDVSEMYKPSEVTNPLFLAKGLVLTASIIATNRRVHLGKEANIRCGKIMCVPETMTSYTVTTSELDLRGNNPIGYPSKFIINTASCDIHLSDSYCAIGYTSFIVDQSTEGKICTIYKSDDDVTPIFDGNSLGTGIYRLTAYCAGSSENPIIYDTTNDTWEIEKIG